MWVQGTTYRARPALSVLRGGPCGAPNKFRARRPCTPNENGDAEIPPLAERESSFVSRTAGFLQQTPTEEQSGLALLIAIEAHRHSGRAGGAIEPDASVCAPIHHQRIVRLDCSKHPAGGPLERPRPSAGAMVTPARRRRAFWPMGGRSRPAASNPVYVASDAPHT